MPKDFERHYKIIMLNTTSTTVCFPSKIIDLGESIIVDSFYMDFLGCY